MINILAICVQNLHISSKFKLLIACAFANPAQNSLIDSAVHLFSRVEDVHESINICNLNLRG
uniref:Uncharacterized protein n=1 Tax=Parascaris univalens TaxID=6257 RepID=A0A915C1L4_PARUN